MLWPVIPYQQVPLSFSDASPMKAVSDWPLAAVALTPTSLAES